MGKMKAEKKKKRRDPVLKTYTSSKVWPKIVMAHPESKECYAIGGLRPENQNGSEQCLLIDMQKNIIRMKADMNVGRVGPGVVLHLNYIYVCGGLKTLSEIDRG